MSPENLKPIIPDSNLTGPLVELQKAERRVNKSAQSIDGSEQLQDNALLTAMHRKHLETHDQS